MRSCDIDNRTLIRNTLTAPHIKNYIENSYGVETKYIGTDNGWKLIIKKDAIDGETFKAAKEVIKLLKPFEPAFSPILNTEYGTEIGFDFTLKNSNIISYNVNKLKGNVDKWIGKRNIETPAVELTYEQKLAKLKAIHVPQITMRVGNEYVVDGEVKATLRDALDNRWYQLPDGRELNEYVASEKTIRDLAARMADRIGIPVRFESDRTKEYKGKLENGIAYVNLAYATLDTIFHEVAGHPIIRALKLKSEKTIESEIDKMVEQGIIKKECQ